MNAAAAYALDHRSEAINYVQRRGVPYADAEDVVQDAIVRALRQALTSDAYPGQFWYKALRWQVLDYHRYRRRHPAETLPDDRNQHVPSPPAPIRRSLNGFGTTRQELEAIVEWVGISPHRRTALRKHLRGEPLGVREGEMLVDLQTRLADTPCATCGHFIRLHGDGKYGCALDAADAPVRCHCTKFVKPNSEQSRSNSAISARTVG